MVDDPRWLGEAFLAMPLVDGHVPGEMAAFDPWVQGLPTAERAQLHEAVVDALADLHRADRRPTPCPTAASTPSWRGGPTTSTGTPQRARPCPHWLRPWPGAPIAGRAPNRRRRVLWGDVRLGNVVFADDGSIAAVLDWEMATVGAAEHDLGWWWALEAMQDDLVGGRLEGFPSLADLRDRYEARAGRALQDLDWYEAFALFRSAAILTRIGLLQQRAGLRPQVPLADNPVLDHLASRVAKL